jgi:hypothetical protein
MTNKPEKAVINNKNALSVLLIPVGSLFGTGFGLAIHNLPLGIIGGVTVGGILFGVIWARTNRK